MIVSLFAIPLTLTIESLLVIAEATLFLFVSVKQAESNYSSCLKIIYCLLQALLLAGISFISLASQVSYCKRKFTNSKIQIQENKQNHAKSSDLSAALNVLHRLL